MIAVALLAIAAGALRSLRAPIVVGGAILLTLGLNAAWPYVLAVPRWVPLAVAGAVLLWLGATIEHRMAGFRALATRYRRLD